MENNKELDGFLELALSSFDNFIRLKKIDGEEITVSSFKDYAYGLGSGIFVITGNFKLTKEILSIVVFRYKELEKCDDCGSLCG